MMKNMRKLPEGMNDYVELRREKVMKFENNMVKKCTHEPKLFYKI